MRNVGLTFRLDYLAERDEWRQSIDSRMVSWLHQAGLFPACIPIIEGFVDLENWLQEFEPVGIVFSGGPNLGVFPKRDEFELELLSLCRDQAIPVIGICRGMQLMVHSEGGEILSVDEHAGTRHRVSGEISKTVNSYHENGIFDLPPKFRSLAKSDDGLIEAVAHLEYPWEGWMWHPEREKSFDPEDQFRMRQLFGL